MLTEAWEVGASSFFDIGEVEKKGKNARTTGKLVVAHSHVVVSTVVLALLVSKHLHRRSQYMLASLDRVKIQKYEAEKPGSFRSCLQECALCFRYDWSAVLPRRRHALTIRLTKKIKLA